MTRREYVVSGRCIACGTCLAVCGQNCIAGGAPPFVIRQSYCTCCGRCAEKCPVGAIGYREIECSPAEERAEG